MGFNIGDSSKGINFVDSPDEIRVNSKASVQAAKLIESLVAHSDLKPYSKVTQEGFWRILLYRESDQT